MVKNVKWSDSVYTPEYKRPCECQGCSGCKLNKQCNKYGSNICKKCNEFRCNKCCTQEICKNCLKEY